jgi:hypothetical protein
MNASNEETKIRQERIDKFIPYQLVFASLNTLKKKTYLCLRKQNDYKRWKPSKISSNEIFIVVIGWIKKMLRKSSFYDLW